MDIFRCLAFLSVHSYQNHRHPCKRISFPNTAKAVSSLPSVFISEAEADDLGLLLIKGSIHWFWPVRWPWGHWSLGIRPPFLACLWPKGIISCGTAFHHELFLLTSSLCLQPWQFAWIVFESICIFFLEALLNHWYMLPLFLHTDVKAGSVTFLACVKTISWISLLRSI